jgi:hypothetical protein
MTALPSFSKKIKKAAVIAAACFAAGQLLDAQSILFPWSGFAHTPQHDCISVVPSQPLNRVIWSTPVMLGTPPSDAHFSPPVNTRSNTVIFPLNSTNEGYNFTIEALAGVTGQTNWAQPTDYTGGYICPLVLTPRNRLYVAGAGGTVLYTDTPDATALPSFTRAAFVGLSNYMANSNGYNTGIHICTPITSDRYGDIFFGFSAGTGSPLITLGGLARIDYDGTGSWISAATAIRVTNDSQTQGNSAPALSLDEKTVYMTFTAATGTYLSAIDSRTLAPLANVNLIDPETQGSPHQEDSSASPTVGPDGDVYYGIYASTSDNGYGGWLLHFDGTLSVRKNPGPFGWDVTDSIVNASLVPSYRGNSTYLLATKYNNYITKQYKMALFDPQQGVSNPTTHVTEMAVVLTVPSPNGFEWCINSAAVDPFTKSVLANNEDGNLYRWDLTVNQLTQSVALTTIQTGEAYTPTVIGVDGTVYAINHGYLFAVGQ